MINIFRTYNPINILWLGILVFALRLGYMINAPEALQFIFLEPFARLLIPMKYEYALSPLLNIVFAGVIVFIQALILNRMVNHFNLLSKASYVPALMYVTLSALFTPFLVLSAPLICNFLVLWILFKLFNIYHMADVKATCYDLGMLVAIGSFIYLPFIYLILVVWIALIIFRPFNWREWIAVIIGYATVFLFLAVIYYLNNDIHQFYKIWLPLGTKFPNAISINSYTYLLLIPVVFIFILSAYRLQQSFFKSYVHIRKSFQLLLVFFIVAAGAFYVKSEFKLNHFLLCTIPGAIAFSYYFLFATGRWFYESLYFLLLVGIIYFQFNTF